MIDESVFRKPLVVALLTFLVRIIIYNLKDYIFPLYHFGITTPNTAAETWKEVVFWKHRLGFVPDYLYNLPPWYAEYIPPAPAEVYVIFLCLCDALTVFFVSQWPSAVPNLVFTFFVLNPVMIMLPVLQSLAPLEHLILAVVVECCRRGKTQVWLMHIAWLLAQLLGCSFTAVVLSLWFPVATRIPTRALLGVIFSAAAIGLHGLFYFWKWGGSGDRIALHAPPDNGVMWYVHLLMIPAFRSSLNVLQVEIPAVVTLILAVGLPSETQLTATRHTRSIPGDRRLTLVLFALCFSKAFRSHLALPDCSLVVLFIYTLLDTREQKGLKGGRGQSMFKRIRNMNVFVPLYAMLLVIPLQHGFYLGWIVWDTLNPNWIFFSQVAFCVTGAIFILLFLHAVVDAIKEELEEERGREMLVATTKTKQA